MSHNENHEQAALIKRLNRIEGQIRGIQKMIVEDQPFDDIIIQLNASKAAIQKMSDLLFEAHLEHCFYDATAKGEADRALSDIKGTLKQYSKML